MLFRTFVKNSQCIIILEALVNIHLYIYTKYIYIKRAEIMYIFIFLLDCFEKIENNLFKSNKIVSNSLQ